MKLVIFIIILGGILFYVSWNISNKIISKEKAIEIATKDAGGFLGTWVNAEFKDNLWYINATSKSAKPPVYYIIDKKGKIISKN